VNYLSVEADADTRDTLEYYRQRSHQTMRRFLTALDVAFTLIAERPKLLPLVLGRARRAPLRRFPYRVL